MWEEMITYWWNCTFVYICSYDAFENLLSCKKSRCHADPELRNKDASVFSLSLSLWFPNKESVKATAINQTGGLIVQGERLSSIRSTFIIDVPPLLCCIGTDLAVREDRFYIWPNDYAAKLCSVWFSAKRLLYDTHPTSNSLTAWTLHI